MTPAQEGPPKKEDLNHVLSLSDGSFMYMDGSLPGVTDRIWFAEIINKELGKSDEALERDEKRTAALEKVAEGAAGEETWRAISTSKLPNRWKTEDGEVQDADVQILLFRDIKLQALKDLKALAPAPEEKEEPSQKKDNL